MNSRLLLYEKLRPDASMRINIWIILGILLALFAITRYTHYQKDTERICANDPTRVGVRAVTRNRAVIAFYFCPGG